jgi:hypothetical protein
MAALNPTGSLWTNNLQLGAAGLGPDGPGPACCWWMCNLCCWVFC